MLRLRTHNPFHCGLVSCFFFAVCPPYTRMVINAAACGRLFHLCVHFFGTLISFLVSFIAPLILFSHRETYVTHQTR
ncbi:hypothetical protein EDB19DRAFT_1764236 [Suillus lakei]|nr:hypothetical protein EDB19DRAFT_1764236 [Suillus lakei]